MSKIVLVCLTFTMSVALLVGCTPEPDLSDVEDGVEYITRKYGVPPAQIVELAALLGVSPDELTSPQAFDPGSPFPIPYFREQFEAFEKSHGRKPLRPEIDAIVKGHVAKCQPFSAYTEYLFYSTNVNRSWFWRKRVAAIIMRVEYDVAPGKIYAPDEAVYNLVELRDIPLELTNPWGNMDYQLCTKGTEERAARATATAEAQ